MIIFNVSIYTYHHYNLSFSCELRVGFSYPHSRTVVLADVLHIIQPDALAVSSHDEQAQLMQQLILTLKLQKNTNVLSNALRVLETLLSVSSFAPIKLFIYNEGIDTLLHVANIASIDSQ